MTSKRSPAVAVADAPTIHIEGVFQRHVSRDVRPLEGTTHGGRWGPRDSFPVLYLGRPRASVVVEAYRHLIDNVEGMEPNMVKPRRLITCNVAIDNVLDLRGGDAQKAVGLSLDDMRSDPGDYTACQRVGRAAHQLNLHGILAPAATGLGETLAVLSSTLLPGSCRNL